MCKNNCKICDNLVISDSVTLVTVDGVDTVVIDVPATSFRDGQRICLVIAQTIPTTATIVAPVAISIGGDTTTVYTGHRVRNSHPHPLPLGGQHKRNRRRFQGSAWTCLRTRQRTHRNPRTLTKGG